MVCATRMPSMISCRRAISPASARCAADAEFHVELALASGNALLPALMEALCETMRRLQAEAFERLPDWQAERDLLAVEHDAILASVESGDSAAAGIAMRDHVMRSYRRVMDPPRAPAWPR
jgi:GntR family transcriptional repressor for pyruvate dehydrogenase complex